MVVARKNTRNNNTREKIQHKMKEVEENREFSDDVYKFLNEKDENGNNINNDSMMELIESLLKPRDNNSGGGGRVIKKFRLHSL